MSAHAELLANLLPPVAYDRTGPHLRAQLHAHGVVLDAAHSNGERVANAMSPLECDPELLEDWERVYGLPPCVGASQAQRVARLLAKIRMKPGSLAKQFYIDIAALMGYTITITEGEAFMVGWSTHQVGVTPLNDGYSRFVWHVTGLPNPAPLHACGFGLSTGTYAEYFQVGVHQVGAHGLLDFIRGDTVQDMFETLKPAHTLVTY